MSQEIIDKISYNFYCKDIDNYFQEIGTIYFLNKKKRLNIEK